MGQTGILVCVCVGGILFELLCMYTLPSPDLCSAGTASTTEKAVLLNNIADAEAFVSGAEVAVIGFFQVYSQHLPSASREPYPTLMRA